MIPWSQAHLINSCSFPQVTVCGRSRELSLNWDGCFFFFFLSLVIAYWLSVCVWFPVYTHLLYGFWHAQNSWRRDKILVDIIDINDSTKKAYGTKTMEDAKPLLSSSQTIIGAVSVFYLEHGHPQEPGRLPNFRSCGRFPSGRPGSEGCPHSR